MRLLTIALMIACTPDAPEPERPGALPERYPRCRPGPDEPLIPSLTDLLRWAGEVRELRESVAPAVTERATVPSPPAPTAERLGAITAALTAEPTRASGSPGAQRTLERAAELLEGANAVRHDRERTLRTWTPERTVLTVDGTSVPAGAVALSATTPPGGLTGPLRYLGEGELSDFVGQDFTGEILVMELVYVRDDPDPADPFAYGSSDPEGWLVDHPGGHVPALRENLPGRYYLDAIPGVGTNATDDVVTRAASAGAAGVVLLLSQHPSPDDLPLGPGDGLDRPLPTVYVPRSASDALREAAIDGATATVEVAGSAGSTSVVESWFELPGARPDTLVLSAHVDAPFAGFTEDAAGLAQLVAQVEAWSTIPVEDRPYRLVAVLTDGHFVGADGARQLVAANPALLQHTHAWISVGGLGVVEARWDDEAGAYAPTGQAERTTLFVSHDAPLVTAVLSGLADAEPPTTRVRTTAGLLPPAELAGVLVHAADASPELALRLDCSVPFVSWRSAAPWQIDANDGPWTLDPALQARYAHGLTAILAHLMATPEIVEIPP